MKTLILLSALTVAGCTARVAPVTSDYQVLPPSADMTAHTVTAVPVQDWWRHPVRTARVATPSMVAQHTADLDSLTLELQIAAIDARLDALETK